MLSSDSLTRRTWVSLCIRVTMIPSWATKTSFHTSLWFSVRSIYVSHRIWFSWCPCPFGCEVDTLRACGQIKKPVVGGIASKLVVVSYGDLGSVRSARSFRLRRRQFCVICNGIKRL